MTSFTGRDGQESCNGPAGTQGADPTGLQTITSEPTPHPQVRHTPAAAKRPEETAGPTDPSALVVCMTEDQFNCKRMKENHALPATVLVLGGGATLVIHTVMATGDGGLASMMGAGIFNAGVLIMLIGTGMLTRWIVAKILAENFGALDVLALRTAAVICALELATMELTVAI